MKILIKNGHVIDPDTKLDQVADVLLEDDKIQEVKENIKDKADRVIDARGCYVMPGLIDMHVHLRDPGRHIKRMYLPDRRLRQGVVLPRWLPCQTQNRSLIIRNGFLM